MARTRITGNGRDTVPAETRRHGKRAEIIWESCPDGTARMRPAPSVIALFGAARSATPRDKSEKAHARVLIGRRDRGK